MRERDERIQQLNDEVARLKGEKGKPKIKPSRLEPKEKVLKPESDAQESPDSQQAENQVPKKRPGSEKRHKTVELTIHETEIVQQARRNSSRLRI